MPWRLKARSGADLVPAQRKLIYVPETARLEKRLAAVVSNGNAQGLSSMNKGAQWNGNIGNILEELVGQNSG